MNKENQSLVVLLDNLKKDLMKVHRNNRVYTVRDCILNLIQGVGLNTAEHFYILSVLSSIKKDYLDMDPIVLDHKSAKEEVMFTYGLEREQTKDNSYG